jgi:nucleoside-diphosphate-sugar epimerase
MTDGLIDRNALVTGATGFIGGHLVRRLLQDGWSVRLLVRSPSALPIEIYQQCEVVEGDLSDMNALVAAVSGVAVVYHCAANVNTWDNWYAYSEANIVGVQNLLNAIAECNSTLSRLVHVSTVDVYGFPELPCNEMSVTSGGAFGYGRSKLIGEQLVGQWAQQHRVPVTIVRPCNVIGPGSQFIQRLGIELQSGVMLEVNGGRANAGLVYIDNLIDCMVWVACADKAIGKTYNVRDTCDVTWSEFLLKFRGAINGKGIVINLPYGVATLLALCVEWFHRSARLRGEPFLHRLLVCIFGRTCGHDASRIRLDSGLKSSIGFDEALRRCVQSFHSQSAKN